MKKYLILIAMALPLLSLAQTKKDLQDSIKDGYRTSLGWRIHERDTLKLGIGGMPNHMYAFIYRSPVNALKLLSSSNNSGYHETSDDGYNKVYLKSDQAKQAIVKSIFIQGTKRGGYSVMAKVGVGDMSNYWIELDNAVQASEIVAPGTLGLKQKNNNIASATTQTAVVSDKFDQLKKLKDLLDSGAISKDEYAEQKKKLLAQ
jgi:hypothetical protein